MPMTAAFQTDDTPHPSPPFSHAPPPQIADTDDDDTDDSALICLGKSKIQNENYQINRLKNSKTPNETPQKTRFPCVIQCTAEPTIVHSPL